ncbi:MAG: hypothetical protein KJ072_23200 [Verrucomicrobia bacterium]|nr:hypothetical protein [Verrucomicrobiota bacterium]
MKTRASNLLRYVLIAGVVIWGFAPEAVSAQTPGQISITHDGLQLTLSWDSVSGRSYQVLSTADLAVPWEEVATEPKPLVSVGNRLSYSVSVARETRFYRVTELPEVTPPGSDYLVIDLSGGLSASSYPVSYLSSVPAGDGRTSTRPRS